MYLIMKKERLIVYQSLTNVNKAQCDNYYKYSEYIALVESVYHIKDSRYSTLTPGVGTFHIV